MVAAIEATLQIGPITLFGFIRIEVAGCRRPGSARVDGRGRRPSIPFLGSLSGTLNLTIYVGAKTGVVGRVQLARRRGGDDPFGQGNLFALEGDFLIEINAVVGGSGPETVDTFIIGADGKFVHNADGSFQTGSVSINPGFKLRLAGKLTLLSVVELEGRFTLDIHPGEVEITLVAKLKINPIGQLDATGGLRINSAGVVLYADLAMNTGFGGAIGLQFSASAHLEFNATAADQDFVIDGVHHLVRQGLLMRIEGSIEFLGFASAHGFAEFSITPTETRILFGVGFNLGGLSFSADGGAEVAYGNDPGIALSLNVHARADADIFVIDASGTIQINTTNSTRLGIQGHSFLLSLNGEVKILELLIFDAGFTVRRCQRRLALRLQRQHRLLRTRHDRRPRLPRLDAATSTSRCKAGS